MKTLSVALFLFALPNLGAATGSTVTCSSCASPTSTNDIVTRLPVPSVNCTAPPLVVVVNGTTSIPAADPTNTDSDSSSTGTPGPTEVPVGGSSKAFANIGGAAAAAMALLYLL